MEMATTFQTDCGQLREHNEDNGGILAGRNATLAVVADGMGGHRAGDVASALVLKKFRETWDESADLIDADTAKTWLKKTILNINTELYQYSRAHEECRGMGTTLVCALCLTETVIVANIGDSRSYLLDESGLSQITEDHSLVNELVKSGQLSPEDAVHHPRKNVLMRALGTESSIDIDLFTIDWKAGDLIFLCSDGLTNMLDNSTIAEELSQAQNIQEAGEKLVQLANLAGGEDNITLSIVKKESLVGEAND